MPLSDCVDAQAGLGLCCSQTPEDRFSGVEAHTKSKVKINNLFLSVKIVIHDFNMFWVIDWLISV